MEVIIGLIGAKGAGKTTAYGFTKELFPESVELTLAGKLKEVSSLVTGIPLIHFNSHEFKEKHLDVPVSVDVKMLRKVYAEFGLTDLDYDKFYRPHIGKILTTPREIAQYVGTEVLRGVDDEIHCKNCTDGKSGTIGVVTDIRFPNEFEFFKNNYPNFIPIYIKNTTAETAAGSDTHESESHLKSLALKAAKVSNDDTIENFRDRYVATLKDLLGARL